MDGLLEHARTVAEREEMLDSHLRNGGSLAPSDDWINRKRYSRSGGRARSLKHREITLGRLRPRHRSTRRVGAFAHGITADVVRKQARDFGAHGVDIAKRNQNAAP